MLLAGLFLGSTVQADNSGFPGRQEFKDIPVMELNELIDQYKDVVIVDTRSHYEYDTLRIKGAVNIPVAEDIFETELAALRKKSDKTIVFYCNGRTCYKSYIAVKKAKAVGINNTIAFDAGIFEWTVAHPDKAMLLNKSPVDTRQLISKKEFHARMLDPDTFSDKIFDLDRHSLVIDVRDKYQRAGVGFYPGKEKWASLDDQMKLLKYIEKAKRQNKTLFIYDEVGKQVRWLQYALERAGIKNYYFMTKGAKGYYDTIVNTKRL